MTTPRPEPIDSALRTLRLLPRLHRWAVASVQAHDWGQGLSMRQLSVLAAVRDGVSSPGLLARRLLVTPAVITGLLDRLERQGHVRRETEAEDRRRLRLVLTKSGRAVSEAVHQALARELASRLGATSNDLESLGRALELLERALGAPELQPEPLPLGEDEDVETPGPQAPRARRPRTAASERAGKTALKKKRSK